MASHGAPEPYTYRVFLREESPSPAIASPVKANRLDYYDSGIWIHLDEGRVFLPYHQVQLIREAPDNEEVSEDDLGGAIEAEEQSE